jgi:hypothetical protein
MLPTVIDNSLVISASMALLPCGNPDAVQEVQRQMRLINQAYRDPEVLRLTDDCVRFASELHSPPGPESEDLRRSRARAALHRLRACLDGLPAPEPRGLSKKRVRAR